jgi:hypothetical protein
VNIRNHARDLPALGDLHRQGAGTIPATLLGCGHWRVQFITFAGAKLYLRSRLVRRLACPARRAPRRLATLPESVLIN